MTPSNPPGATAVSNRLVVGIADMELSSNEEDILVTYALGSCLGVAIYDPEARVGGVLHAMLPSAEHDPDKARTQPARFVDSGVIALFKNAYRLGAVKERIIVKVAGGACVTGDERSDTFQIGKRNLIALKRLLWKNGVLLKGKDVGGKVSRTLILDMASGQVRVRTNGSEAPL
mgnify:FL=1